MNINKMISIVQIYIHHRKGVEVDISIKNTRDLILLSQAYRDAVDWMGLNNFKYV